MNGTFNLLYSAHTLSFAPAIWTFAFTLTGLACLRLIGLHAMTSELRDILTTPHAPSFIYLHHPHTSSSSSLSALPPSLVVSRISAIEYNNPRLLYASILHRLADALSTEWTGGDVNTWDGFVRGLRTLRSEVRDGAKASKKGKEKAKVSGHEDGAGQGEALNWVVVVTEAERLPRILGSRWAVLTRMSELIGIPLTLVLASQIPWDMLRPPAADAQEPVHIYIPPLSRQETHTALLSASSHPLWPHFLNLFLATFFPLAPTLADLAYLAAPLWELYTGALPPHAESTLIGIPHPDTGLPPKLDISVKLLTDLKFSLSLPLTLAIEHLLPRQIGPREFVRFLKQTQNPLGAKRGIPRLPGLDIPLVGKFLVVAGYLASQNPAKSDLRLFGRGLGVDGKRKRGGGTRRAGYGRVKVGKVPQRLLGPKPFPLDRLLAIFSSLYSEHAERPPDLQQAMEDDDDPYASSSSESGSDSGGSSAVGDLGVRSPSRRKGIARESNSDSLVERQRRRVERKRRRDVLREERWEEEVEAVCMSTRLWALIPELEGQGLFRRMSPPDRLDNIILRCEVDYEAAKAVARELRLTLDEYLYEAQN